MILWTLESGAYAATHCAPGIDEAAHAAAIAETMPAGATWAIVDAPPSPTLAEVAASAVAAIKAEAGVRIMAAFPQFKQANMTARAVELIAAGKVSGQEWAAIEAAWNWIKAVRIESNRIEAAIVAAPDVEAVEAARASAQWPVK